MATQEYKIVQAVVGADKLDALTAKLSLAEQKLKALIEAEQAAVAAGASWSGSVTATAAAVGDLKNQIGVVERELGKLTPSTRNAGRAILELSRGLEDLSTGGFIGILNNIPGIVQALGGAAGLTGAISGVAVGAYVLYKNWDTLLGIFGSGKIETEAEVMERLAKATHRTAEEEALLLKLRKQRQNIDAQNEEPKAVTDFQKRVNEAVVDGPKGAIVKGIDADFGDRIRTQVELAHPEIPESQRDATKLGAYIDDRQKRLDNPDTDPETKTRAASELAGAKAALEKLNELYAAERDKFLANPDHAKAIGEAAGAHPERYGPNRAKFAAAMILATPENQETPEYKINIKRQEDAYKSKKADEKRDKEQIKKDEDDFELEAQKVYRQQTDAKKKDEDDFELEAQKVYKEQTEAKKKRVDDAKDALGDTPKFSEGLQTDLLKRQLSGQVNPDAMKEVQASLAKSLMEKYGVDQKEADEIAKDKVGNANKTLQEDLIDQKPENRNSEVVDAGKAFAEKIQSSISGENVQKSQLEQLKELVALAKKGQQVVPMFQ